MILYCLFIFFLIASAITANKMVLFFMTPVFFIGIRMISSGTLLILLSDFNKETFKKAYTYIYSLFFISLFTTFIPSLLKAFALSSLPSSRAAFWGTFEPFIAAFFMYVLYNEKLTKRQTLGCLMGVLGAIYFIFMRASVDVCLNDFIVFSIPDLLQIAAIFIGKFGWINIQKLIKQDFLKAQQINGLTHFISGTLSLVLSLFLRENMFINHSFSSLPACFFIALIYTIIVGNMIAYTLLARLLKHTSVVYTSLIGLSTPLFVHLLGPFFLNEAISIHFFISIGFIFLGLYFFNKKNKEIVVNQI